MGAWFEFKYQGVPFCTGWPGVPAITFAWVRESGTRTPLYHKYIAIKIKPMKSQCPFFIGYAAAERLVVEAFGPGACMPPVEEPDIGVTPLIENKLKALFP